MQGLNCAKNRVCIKGIESGQVLNRRKTTERKDLGNRPIRQASALGDGVNRAAWEDWG